MSHISLEEIAELCAREFGVSVEQMRQRQWSNGKGQATPAHIARNAVVWLARRHTKRSFGEIARCVGLDGAQRRRAAERAAKAFQALLETGELDDHLERIEAEIDRIHEARIDQRLADEGRIAA